MHQNGFLLGIRSETIDNGLLVQLDDMIKKNPNIRLIIIDTFQLVRGQMNKNDTLYGNDYKEVSKIKKFADDKHICIVLIHHFRKMSDISDTFNQISGSTGITGAADTMITIQKEKRFGDKTILAITGRDIEGGEFLINNDEITHKWNIMGSQDQINELQNQEFYNNNPIVITVKKLLSENNNSLKISSTKLYNEIIFTTKRTPKQKNAAALTKYISSELKMQLLKYDSIYYERPNPNGGSAGRILYFCKNEKI